MTNGAHKPGKERHPFFVAVDQQYEVIATHPQLNATDKFLAAHLLRKYVNRKRFDETKALVCWPGIARLAHDTGLSSDQIDDALAKLHRLGILIRTRRGRGTGQTTERIFNLECAATVSPRQFGHSEAVSPRELGHISPSSSGSYDREIPVRLLDDLSNSSPDRAHAREKGEEDENKVEQAAISEPSPPPQDQQAGPGQPAKPTAKPRTGEADDDEQALTKYVELMNPRRFEINPTIQDAMAVVVSQYRKLRASGYANATILAIARKVARDVEERERLGQPRRRMVGFEWLEKECAAMMNTQRQRQEFAIHQKAEIARQQHLKTAMAEFVRILIPGNLEAAQVRFEASKNSTQPGPWRSEPEPPDPDGETRRLEAQFRDFVQTDHFDPTDIIAAAKQFAATHPARRLYYKDLQPVIKACADARTMTAKATAG